MRDFPLGGSSVAAMRLGVIDVGSNTVHLLVVDAHPGAQPIAANSHKIELRLSEHVRDDGRIADSGAKALATFVAQCLEVAEDRGVEELLPFATSAIREAPNGDDVLARVKDRTGVELQVLSGEDEARLTFLAARRWKGWSAGKLLVLDIGGGSLELSIGLDEDPDVAESLLLGAGRVTRELLAGDPPSAQQIKAARKHVRAEIAANIRALHKAGAPDCVVGTSKTMRLLARLSGAAPSSEGPYVKRTLTLADATAAITRLAPLTAAERAALPGVSVARAPQALAGAIIAEAAMDLVGVEALEVCPWALREGLILRYLDHLG